MAGKPESIEEVPLSDGESAAFPVPPPLSPAPPPGPAPIEGRTSILIRYASAFYIAIGLAIAIGIFFLFGALNWYSIPFIFRTLPSGVGPFEISLEFTTYTYLLAMGAAMGLGLVRAFPPKRSASPKGRRRRSNLSLAWRWPLYGFASGFVAAIRGTPFLVQLNIVWLVMIFSVHNFTYLGWDETYWAGFIALLINTMGYQTEVFRGGFQSVGQGQVEGARAVGMSRTQTFFRITMPQAFRLMTLPLTNEWISNFKTATILSVIGIFELYAWSSIDIAEFDAQPVPAFIELCIFYLAVNVALSRIVTYVEKRRRIPGLGSPDLNVGTVQRFLGFRIGGSGPKENPPASFPRHDVLPRFPAAAGQTSAGTTLPHPRRIDDPSPRPTAASFYPRLVGGESR